MEHGKGENVPDAKRSPGPTGPSINRLVEQEARERARAVAVVMFEEMVPGNLGADLANEVADRIMAAVLEPVAQRRLPGRGIDVTYLVLRRRLLNMPVPGLASRIEKLDDTVAREDSEAIRIEAANWDGYWDTSVKNDLLKLADRIDTEEKS